MDYIKKRVKELSTWNGIILLAAYIVMWFTPDNIDQIIQHGLLGLGIANSFLPDTMGSSTGTPQ